MYIPFFGAMRPARSRCLGGADSCEAGGTSSAARRDVKWASYPAVTIGTA